MADLDVRPSPAPPGRPAAPARPASPAAPGRPAAPARPARPASPAPPTPPAGPAADPSATARAQLRAQIAVLERRLSETVIACLPYGDPAAAAPAPAAPTAPAGRGPRVLGLGDLERARDDLAARLAAARAELHRRGEREARARVRLERMRLEPGRHRFERVTRAELGEGRCGVWQVRPRHGLLGMLMGWWEVKLSSGCP
jgi:hypothetical protein